MEREEKIKIAITAGIAAVILLILVFILAFGSGKKNEDDAKMEENIIGYADSDVGSSETDAALLLKGQDSSIESSTDKSSDNADTAATTGEGANDASTASTIVESQTQAASDSKDAKKDTTQDTSKDSTKDTSASKTGSTTKKTVTGDIYYPITGAELKDVYKSVKYNADAQLKEMYTYWSDGNTAAVRDLAHLERFEAMSYTLKGSKDFYYYGDKDSSGKPNGTGLAVYADSQYYFGSWKDGVRSGEGTWICFYPNNSNNVVAEHLYTGGWLGDLPDGQGQEHLDYMTDRMAENEIYLQNAIGGFSKGLYDGDMYIITVDSDEDTTEWTGKCGKGSFEQIPYAAIDSYGLLPVMNEREDSENHLYISEKKNKDNGVTNMITGGTVRR